MIQVRDTELRSIRVHGTETYREEACGILFGHQHRGATKVVSVARIDNRMPLRKRERRYLLTPADFRWAESEAVRQGLTLVGIYHSHPDSPAQPSAFDLDHALPFFSYIILSVMAGQSAEIRSFVLSEDRKRFLEEPIITTSRDQDKEKS